MAVPLRFRFCFFAFTLLPAWAWITQAIGANESGRPLLQSFTPRDYAAHNQIWSIAQDRDGVMWFGNVGSVLAYDGVRWRRVLVPSQHIRNIAFTPDGRLYLSAVDELGYLEPNALGEMQYISLVAKLPEELRPPGIVWSMAVDGDAVYFANDVAVMRWSGGQFKTWTFPTQHRQYVKVVAGQVWLHRRGEGLRQLVDDKFVPFSEAPELQASRFLVLLDDGPKGVFIGADGAVFFHAKNGRLEPFRALAAPLFAGTQLLAGVRLPDGGYVIGTVGAGAIVLDANGRFVQRINESSGLLNESLICLATDRAGGVWFGTNNGIARAELSGAWSVFDRYNGLGQSLVLDLVRHRGVLYAGTNHGLYQLRAADEATGVNARFEPVAGIAQTVWSLYSHESGLLLGTDNGLKIFNGIEAPQTVNPELNGAVLRLLGDRDSLENLFAAQGDGGVQRWRYRDKKWTADPDVMGSKIAVQTLAQDTSGAIWGGTESRGFVRIAPGEGHDWTHPRSEEFFQNHGLPTPHGNSRVIDTTDGVLFSPGLGLYHVNPATIQFERMESIRLPGGDGYVAFWPVVAERDGTLWTASNGNSTTGEVVGSFALDAAKKRHWRALPDRLGSAAAQEGVPFLLIDEASQTLWMNGPDASIRVDLATIKKAETLAPKWRALIREVILPDGSHRFGQSVAAQPLTFAYAREPLTFLLAAPQYSSTRKPEFQTRLRGYDETWSVWSKNTEVSFTNLSGGPFTLEVRARDADGATSDPASFAFAVTPPWPRRPWAFVFYGIAGVGFVYGFLRWRLARVTREQRRLEGIVIERTRDLAAARDQAESASRAKSAFLASMSHELRTPLNGVIGYAQLLQSDPRLVADQRERVRIVHQSGEHLLHMINDVLDLAKIEAGKMELRLAPFALAEMIHDAVAVHAAHAAQKQIHFQQEVAADLPAWVEGDAQKLRQVLENLLGNAVKFTERGSIMFRVGRDAEKIRFTVDDTGAGISADDQAHLFQPFEQAHKSRPLAPGTGLGLAIARALVEKMNGQLTVISVLGKGSSFTFAVVLPERASLTNAIEPTAVTGYRGRRRRVTVVDDHAVNRNLLMELLTPLGFEMEAYFSGTETLAAWSSRAEGWPDLAILDLRMDVIDGLELTRRLRALPRGSEVKVLLTSASVLSFNPDEARKAGCDDFLPKPFRTADLVEKIGRLLDLQWETEMPVVASRASEPIAAPMRAKLAEVLSEGDLENFRAVLAVMRKQFPGSETHWEILDRAAAGFQLSVLRQLLQ